MQAIYLQLHAYRCKRGTKNICCLGEVVEHPQLACEHSKVQASASPIGWIMKQKNETFMFIASVVAMAESAGLLGHLWMVTSQPHKPCFNTTSVTSTTVLSTEGKTVLENYYRKHSSEIAQSIVQATAESLSGNVKPVQSAGIKPPTYNKFCGLSSSYYIRLRIISG